MRVRRPGLIGVIAMVVTASLSGQAQASRSQSMGPLAVHPQNPRYFQNTATGRVVYLTGSHTWSNLVDIGPSDPPPQFDYPVYLDWMARLNHNFMRLWTWELVSWDTKANGEGKHHTSAPQPYARTGPGMALDGKPKFDLTKYDPAYFNRLFRRVSMARDRGIYVSVMLFEGWGPQFSPGAWEGHPFHPNNNINGIDGDANGDGSGVEVHELGRGAVTEIQEAYVRKVIDTVNEFDNVLYEISNENHPPSTEWQYHMIRFIKEYERNKPQQHPVGMTFQYKGGKNETLFDSPADWISPNPEGGYRDDPPPADGRKVVINDTDHLWGIGGNLAWVWKSFTRGYHPIFMDPYDGNILGNRFDPKWDPIRRTMGHTLQYARRMDLAKTVPSPDAASTKYCLAHPGNQYLIYRPAGSDSVSVKMEVGTYRYEWFDPAGGKRVSVGTRTIAEAETSFSSPIQGDAVLFASRAVFPAQDWQQASPESQGLNSIRLGDATEYLRENSGPDGISQLLIVRNGYMVWKGPEIDKVHGVWSATKSFTSTVLGLLIDDGKATLDTLAKDHIPAMANAYPNVTLRHFTTMTSGYRAMKDEPRGPAARPSWPGSRSSSW